MCHLCSQITKNGYDGYGSSAFGDDAIAKPGEGTDVDDDLSEVGYSFIPSIISQVAATQNDLIDALAWGWKWAYPNWSYSFPQDPAEYFSPALGEEDGLPGPGYESIVGFWGFNDQQQTQIVSALSNIETFLPVAFLAAEEVEEGDLDEGEFFVDFRFAIAELIDYGYGSNGVGQEYELHGPGGGGSAEAVVPDPFLMNWRAMGDTWYISDVYDAPVPGSFASAAGLMHEFGHALGLKHGHQPQFVLSIGESEVDEDAFLFAKPEYVRDAPALPYEFDSQEYSVMTYRTYVGNDPFDRGPADLPSDLIDYPWTFMMLDVATLQHLYGANFGEGSNPGDTTYRFDSETGQMTIIDTVDGEHVTQPSLREKIFLTIWDGGGEDTYDFSNYTEDMHIDMRPGEWIAFSNAQLAQLGDGIYAKGNIANALLYEDDHRSLVDNVIAGRGDHAIIGNQADNYIYANEGDSRIYASAGNDVIDGGAGQDTVVYWETRASFEIALDSAGPLNVLKPNGEDMLIAIERAEFSDGSLIFDVESANLGYVYRLYAAALGRAPDEDGLRFWVETMDMVEGLESPIFIAEEFVASQEFQTVYGESSSPSVYIEDLYLNALSRPADEAGLDFWSEAMKQGADRAELLISFSESLESIGQKESDLAVGVWVV